MTVAHNSALGPRAPRVEPRLFALEHAKKDWGAVEKNTRKMAACLSNCSACGGPCESVEEGLVCVKCGVFIESSKLTDYGTGIAMTAEGTLKVADGPIGRLRNNRGTSEGEKMMQACLFKQMKNLRLSASMSSQIRSFLFETVYPSKKAWRMTIRRHIITACCIYIVCRQNGMALSLGQMAQLAECCRFALGRSVKIVCEKLGITLGPLEASDYVLTALGQFGVDDKTLERLTFDLVKLCKDFLLSSSKQPLVVAVSVVIVVLESQGKPPNKATILKVSGESGVKEGAVFKAVRDLKGYLLNMMKEIPWLSSLIESASKPVNKMTVSKFVPDIIRFNQQCSKPDYTVVKPTWLRQKEKNNAARLKKIASAKLRIAEKKQLSGENSDIPGRNPASTETNTGVKTSTSSNEEHPISSGDPLESEDAMIEYLLENGFDESQLRENNLESLYYSCGRHGEVSKFDMEREVLDEGDIAEENLHEYLRNPEEVDYVRQIQFQDKSDADGAQEIWEIWQSSSDIVEAFALSFQLLFSHFLVVFQSLQEVLSKTTIKSIIICFLAISWWTLLSWAAMAHSWYVMTNYWYYWFIKPLYVIMFIL